jgi:N-methylhydantoinase A
MALSNSAPAEITLTFNELEHDAIARFAEQGYESSEIRHRRALDMRYHGQEHTVRLPLAGVETADALQSAFHKAHQQQYTFSLEGTPIEIVNFRLTSTVDHRRPAMGRVEGSGTHTGDAAASAQRCIDVDGARTQADIYRRSALPLGFRATGPAIVEEPSSTTLVLPGQQFEVDGYGNLVISSIDGGGRTSA